MTKGGGSASRVPAGYTYLGQFVDHDLTFDHTAVALGVEVSPADLLQGRSPSLDLDSLYGAGPADPESAKFYADDLHLKTGRTVAVGGLVARDGFDLPRSGVGSARAKRRALIPDFRNDENLAVASTHLAMVRFHNRMVDKVPASVPTAQRFRRARRQVTRHYQWMIRHDYLPRICRKATLDDVFENGRKIFEVGADPLQVPTMPIEFSIAAFRLGHSMVREAYDWNGSSPTARARWTCCSPSRRPAGTWEATRDCPATGSPTSGGSTTSGRPAAPTSRCPRAGSTAPCASTPCWSTRCATSRPAPSAVPRWTSTTPVRISPSAT